MDTNAPHKPWYILPVIVVSFFMVTCLWFATNIIISDLGAHFNLPKGASSDLISVVQLGFMFGTFVFALTNITDKLAPRTFFLINAVVGALANLAMLYVDSFTLLLLLRFITGICMGGAYPAAIKMTATWFPASVLGKAMGFTVGALSLGTAFPHILAHFGTQLVAHQVVYVVVGLSLTGGIMMYTLVPNGPFLKATSQFSFQNIVTVFKAQKYRKALFGYLGHMWELFAFWQFLPLFVLYYNTVNQTALPVSLIVYFTIAFGFVGCVVGGYKSVSLGSLSIAKRNLVFSALCCLLSPFLVQLPTVLFVVLLLIWGATVLGDSPQFSTLVSQAVPGRLVGTAITIMTCLGYTLSIVSIQLLAYASAYITTDYLFSLLLIGPLFGYLVLPKE